MTTFLTIASYRPKTGKEHELLHILESHIPVLREEQLITDRELLTLQAGDGTIIEIFEWKSNEAKDQAHQSQKVMAVWDQISAAAEIVSLASLPEAQRPFPNFKLI